VGPEALQPPKAAGELCLLVSRPGHDPIGGPAGMVHLGSVTGEPPGIGSLSACLLVPGPWLASVAGLEPKAGHRGAVDRVPRARSSPRASGQRRRRVKVGQTPWPEGACERARWA
jgi:hypothetical protein